MGSTVSQLSALFQTLKSIISSYKIVLERISHSPGIPQLNGSIPYWTVPLSPIAEHGKEAKLPEHADVVVIGSGITGTSVARCLLENDESLTIVMLEARDACSGATARNGGHISPNVYNEFSQLKTTHGLSAALQIIRFRLAHISALILAAGDEHLLADSQARTVQEYDVYLNQELFDESKGELREFVKEAPQAAEGFTVIEGGKAIEDLGLSPSVVGCISTAGAAIHPYRFVTGILSNLLSRYPKNFQLFTRTPCTGIVSIPNSSSYIVKTPRGELKTSQVIHATNAWSSHLLPGMRKKIVPTRVHMSAQRPCQELTTDDKSDHSWAGTRAFVFYPSSVAFAFDYLTQLLPSTPSSSTSQCPSSETLTNNNYPPTSGELMFGGGALIGGRSEQALMDNIGVTDDSGADFEICAYLGGALARYFANWGPEATPSKDEDGGLWGKGRVKATWTGIMGLSADMKPWVGRVPTKISGRKEPRAERSRLAPPGEWIAAGYSGEGMVHAWLSGKALASMLLGGKTGEKGCEVELPLPFLVTEKRWKKANIENLMRDLGT